MSTPVFRFAPSPNGELHLGHALSALLNADMARAAGGRLLLRIEDIDVTRCTPEFETAIYRDLEWLGLDWERPVRRQSEHFAEYEQTLKRLIAEGLAYPAFMSRGEIRAHIAAYEAEGQRWPRDPDGVPLYPDADKRLTERERRRRIADGAPFAWRLDAQAAIARLKKPLTWREYTGPDLQQASTVEADPAAWGDVIIARREIPTSYHLAVVADDAAQGVTHVVRGMDIRPATGIHRLLQDLLGYRAPAYLHHRLILGPDGRKLSKSIGSTSLRALREGGATPADIRRLVGIT